MDEKKLSIDFVNNGKEFDAPPMNESMRVSLYLDLLRIELEIKKKLKPYEINEKENPDDYMNYQILMSQELNMRWLTRIFQSIDPTVTIDMVDNKGSKWVNQILKTIYENAPDKVKPDFQGTAEEKPKN